MDLLQLNQLVQLLITLIVDASESWLRMLIALALSVVVGLAIGILAARSRRAGKVILPVVDILQTLPILAFFPFVIYVVVAALPSHLGVNAAVVFLIVTSMLWNIIFGVYESVKTLPNEVLEVASIYRLNLVQRLTRIYVPASMPKVVEQSVLSWSIGLFYLVTSEIFSTGTTNYQVAGIGTELTSLALSGDFTSYAIGLGVFLCFVVATRFLLFERLERHYSRMNEAVGGAARPAHKLQGRAMHRVRLFRELSGLFYSETKGFAPLERDIKKVLLGRRAVPLRESPRVEAAYSRGVAYFWAAMVLAAAVAAVALYWLGIIRGEALGYELMSLGALAHSLARVWLAFGAIVVVAVPVCVYVIFFAKHMGRYITAFQVLASVPATIVLPVIVYALQGYRAHAELVAFAVFFLSGIWYLIFSVLADSRALQGEIFEVKRVFNVTGLDAWKNIYIKAIAPGLITGAVTGIAAEWNASIVAEYFTSTGVGGGSVLSAVSTGMGKLLDTSLAGGNLTLMAIALINLTLMIILINVFLWNRLYRRVSEVYK